MWSSFDLVYIMSVLNILGMVMLLEFYGFVCKAGDLSFLFMILKFRNADLQIEKLCNLTNNLQHVDRKDFFFHNNLIK